MIRRRKFTLRLPSRDSCSASTRLSWAFSTSRPTASPMAANFSTRAGRGARASNGTWRRESSRHRWRIHAARLAQSFCAARTRRILPVLNQLRRRLKIPISIDTRKAEVADAAAGWRRTHQRCQRAAFRSRTREIARRRHADDPDAHARDAANDATRTVRADVYC